MASDLQHESEPWRRRMFPIVAAVAIFASLSVWQAIASEGFLEADGCTHYMYARWAFEYPVYFVDIWGRPFKTALYAPAAATFGLIGVRLTALCVAISIAFIAYAIAKRQRYRWPALALIFTLAQPLVFLHSFSELTELPFAMLLGLAFLAYQRRVWWALTILAGLLPLSRPEGFGFVLLTAGLLAAHRKWLWLPVLAIPVMGWQIVGAIMYREPGNWWNWLPTHWPYAGDSLYPRGPIWHFAALLPAVVGPVLFPFVLIGAWRAIIDCHPARTREGLVGRFSVTSQSALEKETFHTHGSLRSTVGMTIGLLRLSHAARCLVLIAAIPLMILVGHSILYALGKMASNGELRYMLIVAPFWALLAARGWEWVWERFVLTPSPSTLGEGRGEGSCSEPDVVPLPDRSSLLPLSGGTHSADHKNPHPTPLPVYRERERLGWRSPFRYAAVAAIAPVFANLGYKVLPLVQTEDWKTAARIAEWYKTSGVATDYPYIMAAHPGIAYALDRALLDPRLAEWSLSNVERHPSGTVLVWDWVYGEHNADRRKSVGFSPVSRWWIDDPITLRRLLPPAQKRKPYHSMLILPSWLLAFSPETIDGRPTATTQSSAGDPEWRIKRW